MYKISCIDNNSYYYGSSENIIKRWSYHKSMLCKNKHDNPIVQNTWNKYGEAAFQFEIDGLFEKDNLEEIENIYLKEYVGKPGCMNIGTEAHSAMRGRKHTEETKQKISEAGKLRKQTEETKQKIREALQGVPRSEEICKKMSEGMKGNKLWLGRKHTPEARKKMSDAKKGTQPRLGCILSEASRQKMSKSLKGKVPWNKGKKQK